MEIRISARHGELNDEFKDYAVQKLGNLERHYPRTRAVDVLVDEAHLEHIVEVKAHLPKGAPVIVSAHHQEAKAALDLAQSKLDAVLRRHKERWEDRRHGRGAARVPEPEPAPYDDDTTADFRVPDLEA